ncbi:MAG TPA: YncE family protein [Caulobacteraceae bacterium]|jgi:YVTN family beta-propeller protein|nr:YncE family protein [Caulobacteraceae bacterium]
MPKRRSIGRHPGLGLAFAALLAACSPAGNLVGGASRARGTNIYKGTGAGDLSPAVAGALERIYVPNVNSDDVYVIDPKTLKVVDRYGVGANPQHVVPSWDLKTLWVTGSAKGKGFGSLTSIDPATGKPTGSLRVDDAYNMYFTPDGASAIVVAESLRKLEFRDPRTMKLQGEMRAPDCHGLNHADYSPDGAYAVFTCEFDGSLVKIDVRARKVLGYLKLADGGMPQDIRSSPTGELFYVANMMTDGVHLIAGDSFKEVGFVHTGVGAHGLYPSRDGKSLYVANRGSHDIAGKPKGPGSVSVIDFATHKVAKTWPIPGGGSPDMGNVSADGARLWLSGRFDDVVYAIDTTTGHVDSVPVGHTPHGLAVWPQPGRYSLGHTGVMR